MANKKISQLPAASALQNSDLLVAEQNGVAKSVTGTVLLAMLDGHGGIASTSYTPPVAPSLQGTLTLTFADGTSTSIPIYNGAQGAQGEQGEQGEQGAAFTYSDFTPEQLEALRGPQGERGFTGNSAKVWIKWSSVMPTSDADMGDIPDAWMGIYSAAFDEPPASYEDYAWYCIKGNPGAPGLQGEPGARGSYIFQSNYPVRGSEYQFYFLLSDLVAPVSGATPQQGDMAIYGDNYYVFSALVGGNKYYVGTGHSLNSAALPNGGTTGQVLGKASDNDFDVVWKDAGSGSFAVTYGSTSLSAMRQAVTEGKRLALAYNNRSYTVVYSTGGLNDGTIIFTSAADDGTIYWCKAEKASAITPTTTWTNGSASGGGTTDYPVLTNKPSINSVTLSGNKTASDLSLASAADVADLKSAFDEVSNRKLTYQNPLNQFPDADISELKTSATEGYAYSPTGTLVSNIQNGVNGVSLPSAGSLGFLLPVDSISDGDYVFSVRRSVSTTGRCTLQYLNRSLGGYETVNLDAISGTSPVWETTLNITAKKAQYSGLKYLRVLFGNTGSSASVYYMPMMIPASTKYKAFFVNTSSPLSGKKIALDGDSITYGQGFVGGYAKLLGEEFGMTVQNNAVGGATLATGTTTSGGQNRHWISDSISALDEDADYVLISGCINDFFVGVPIGTLSVNKYNSELDTATLIGATEKICRDLVNRFPTKKIGFMLTHSANDWYRKNYQGQASNTENLTIYHDAIITALKKYSIPYCDIFMDGQFSTEIPVLKQYTANNDGIHPTEDGYKFFYCDKISRFLESL